MVAMLALADAIDCLDESSFMPDLSYFSVFLLGLLGGFHCAGMCGGIVVLLNRPVIPIAISAGNAGSDLVSMQARVCEPLASVLARQIAYSLARVGSYSLAGGLMGALGSSALLLKHILPVEQMGFVLVNALMLAFALYLWGWGQSLRWLEPAGRWLWSKLSATAARYLSTRSIKASLAAGFFWGWLPCGMVYGMLLAALASQHALEGALLLASFGLGTLPNLVAMGLGAERFGRLLRTLWLRRAAALVLGAYALAGFMRLDPRAHLVSVVDACISWIRP
jgi:sulfite exporter TauE/SafE